MIGKIISTTTYILASAVFFGAGGTIMALAFDASPIPPAVAAGYIGAWLAILALWTDL